MARVVVTGGKDYLDIDAAGGIVAYAALLSAQDKDVIAASTAPFNASVPQSLLRHTESIQRNFKAKQDDQFAIIDLSDPDCFDTFVVPARVTTIIDHHLGFEAMWKDTLGSNARIEFVGAACTLVYEHWRISGLADEMPKEIAMLLAAGIIDNSLNFKAKLTTKRDKDAFQWLAKYANLTTVWVMEYLEECQLTLMRNFNKALADDTKDITYPGLHFKITIGQLIVNNAQELLSAKSQLIARQLGAITENWYMNILDLTQGASFFYATNPKIQAWLTQILDITFENNVAVADRLWLRKEIYKKVLDEKDRS